MEAVFLKVLNMSITAGYLIPVIIVLRLLLQKAPKSIRCAMWVLVAIRLVCPFSFESSWSLIPGTEPVSHEIFVTDSAPVNATDSTKNSTNYNIKNSPENNPESIDNRQETWLSAFLSYAEAKSSETDIRPAAFFSIIPLIWITGMIIMIFYVLVSYLRIHRKICEAIPLNNQQYTESGIWICDCISTPFISGVLKPRIYLPSSMDVSDMKYVTLHEKAHLKRGDQIWKPLGFLLLSVYWFNPLMWIAYVLFCKDMELACDEKVIREFGMGIKKPYSLALINCSAPRRRIAACPLAFGETGVKVRIKEILNYKKPPFWITAAALVICISAAICLLSDPKQDTDTNKPENQVNNSGEMGDSLLPKDFFNTKFGNDNPGDEDFANYCLSCFYDSAENVDLAEFFHDGFYLEIEESDRIFLKNQGADPEMDIVKLPAAHMDKILTEYFGIALAETNQIGMETFYHDMETDTYYALHNDYSYGYINVLEQHTDENGHINVIYTIKSLPDSPDESEKHIAILQKSGDHYLFLSNQPYVSGESEGTDTGKPN